MEDVLREAEARDRGAQMEGNDLDSTKSAIPAQMDEAHRNGLEEGEVEDEGVVDGKNAESLMERAEKVCSL